MPPPHPINPPPKPPWGQRLRTIFSQTRRALGLVWRSSPAGAVALIALTVVAAVLPPLAAYIGKLIIDAVVAAQGAAPAAREAALSHAVRMVLLELGVVTTMALVDRTLSIIHTVVGSRLSVDVNVMILDKALTLEMRHFENSEFYDKLQRARREASTRPVQLVRENLLMMKNGLSLTGYIVLLAGFSGWMVIAVLLAGVPSFISELKFSMAAFRMRNWRSPEARRLNYMEKVLADDEHAKEVKLFGIGPMLLGRYRQLAEGFHQEDRRLAVRRAAWGYGLSLISTGTFYGCYLAIAAAAVLGRLSLGDMTLYLVAFRQGQNGFQAILQSLGNMYEHNLYMSNLFEYLAIPTTEGAPPAKGAAATRAEEGIRFSSVGFKYPDAKEWALRDIDLFIPKGQSLALVGENGAGKTTFIKLLTRLYEPTEGRIYLDGRDLRDWDPEPLRRRVGVIFQDFNQYQLAVRENVSVGSVDHMEDELRVQRAVEQGGAREVINALTDGLDTQLGRWFRNGVELSGGQWQKVALARAFMREEADILILDEPTAALDAEAEHAVYQRFRTLARGRTTIVISHRFPTVRMADRIIVLEKGRVIEEGTHAELLAAGARYAHLFTLQAEGYQ